MLREPFTILHGESRAQLTAMRDAGVLLDGVVTDPPYEINMHGFEWDRSGIAFDPAYWSLCLDLLKPGAHIAVFAAPRTYHRMACAVEDAGFEVRDKIENVLSTDARWEMFTNSLSAEQQDALARILEDTGLSGLYAWLSANRMPKNSVASLRAANEPILVARKPPTEATLEANIARWGVGGYNIDEARVQRAANDRFDYGLHGTANAAQGQNTFSHWTGNREYVPHEGGRWPANACHDGSEAVEDEFARFGTSKSRKGKPRRSKSPGKTGFAMTATGAEYNDEGTASRFFYCARATSAERRGTSHPSVKPVALMRWLVQLLVPQGGWVLDPFAGSGSTGEAALQSGRNVVLVERNAVYVGDILRRCAAYAQSDEDGAVYQQGAY